MPPPLKRLSLACSSYREKNSPSAEHLLITPGVWGQKSLLSKLLDPEKKKKNDLMNMGKEIQLKPKANVSSYIHFLLNYRNKFKEQQPNTYLGFKEFSRKCSEKWRSISKHEKAKYEALAKLDKARYQEEMRNYVGGKRKRRKRDPQAPRRPPSSFLLFCQDNYAQLKRENPNWSVAQVAKASARMWSTTTDVDKQPYEQRAALLRAKYHEELSVYQKQFNGSKKSPQGVAPIQGKGLGQTESDIADGSNQK
ncbi:high mobility group protein B4 [Sus scrofa]|uniref:High mobility group protein B4 n=3 Tax=Sus scrofa TaxID=9823 RepID=A0A4X1VXZ4_PIG|nr:high mobility group protein B4 [Sus scrofa]